MKEHWEIYLEMQLNLNATGNEGTLGDISGNERILRDMRTLRCDVKTVVFCDVTPCSVVDFYQRFQATSVLPSHCVALRMYGT
jgi:hypothetical protein